MSAGRGKNHRAAGSEVGADEALATLVNQFSDPLVFLRELVQNSLDASSTRIDVDFSFQADKSADTGLMTITVEDNGEGMHEGIIDDYLLTLFRSTKENDLTKIGKFGVGFVSIFAIEPQLVVLDTGQAGESWRIIFHPNRDFEKLRLDEPVEGTTIALHKPVSQEMFVDIRERGRATVRYWCKYAEAELMVDGRPVKEPFGVDAALAVNYREPGTEVALGLAPPRSPRGSIERLDGEDAAHALAPRVGFYNRGLTLVEADYAPDSGARESELFAGLSLRVKSRYLEHTLTRDNVRQDENYAKAVELVRRQIDAALRPKLVAHLEALARRHSGDQSADPGAPDLELALLYARLPSMRLDRHCRDAVIIPTVSGEPVSIKTLESADGPVDSLLCGRHQSHLTRLLGKRGITVITAHGAIVEHLHTLGFTVAMVDGVFHTAMPVAGDGEIDGCLEQVAEFLDHAKARVNRVALGNLDYPGSSVAGRLYIRQEKAFDLTRTGKDDEPGLFGGARELVVNSEHKLVRHTLALARKDRALAAQILAQAICTYEESSAKRTVALAAKAMALPDPEAEGKAS